MILVSHDRECLDRTVTSVLAAEGTGRWIEYAGGYTDMLAQRGEREGESAEVTAPITRKVSQLPASAPAIGRTKRRLSFKEKHALANLPERIDALASEVDRLRKTLADPALFSRDPARFRQAATDLETAEQALATTEEQWLELALLREHLGD